VSISVEVETRIARSPNEVFAALADVERWPAWLIASGIVKVERLDTDLIGVGARLRIHQTVAGRSTVLDAVVEKLEAPVSVALDGRDKDGIHLEIAARLTPDGDATKLRWTVKIGLPLKYRMFESMVTPQARKAAALDLEALRLRLERPVA
jgi:uncharacterized protein YndB with AHSA1/START domain